VRKSPLQSLDGRKYDIACGQIDVGNAATGPMQRKKEGVLQAHDAIDAEPSFDQAEVGRAVAYMAGLSPGRECAVYDDHGYQNALHRARLERKAQ
jgi:hypothetical protein